MCFQICRTYNAKNNGVASWSRIIFQNHQNHRRIISIFETWRVWRMRGLQQEHIKTHVILILFNVMKDGPSELCTVITQKSMILRPAQNNNPNMLIKHNEFQYFLIWHARAWFYSDNKMYIIGKQRYKYIVFRVLMRSNATNIIVFDPQDVQMQFQLRLFESRFSLVKLFQASNHSMWNLLPRHFKRNFPKVDFYLVKLSSFQVNMDFAA